MDLEIGTSNIIQFPITKVEAPVTRPDVHGHAGTMGPIERDMRAKLAKLKDCKYPDTFDWSVYDRIASRFNEPPRGGVVFNTTLKLVNWHHGCSKCHYAFEVDTYGRGCFHDCVYCYAKGQLTTYGYWNKPQPFPVNLAEIRKHFYSAFETDRKTKWGEILKKRIPLRIGSMSDSFMYMDAKYGVTKELLRILRYYKYPYLIFTRSDLVAHDDYLALLDKEICSVQFSISGNNHDFIRKIEPGAPSYRRRLKALKKLASEGIWTTVRINPMFPKYPDGYFTDPDSIIERFGSRENVPTLPFYDEHFIAELSDAGVPSVLAGIVRLSGWTLNRMSEATGTDIRLFFKPEVLTFNSDKNFSDSEVAYYYTWFRNECRKHNMRFNTCYIGNGLKDYFQYQDLWSNTTEDCCDARGNLDSFQFTCQSIPWETRTKLAPCAKQALITRKLEESEDLSHSRSAAVRPDVLLK